MNRFLTAMFFLLSVPLFASDRAVGPSQEMSDYIDQRIQNIAKDSANAGDFLRDVCEFGITDLSQIPVVSPIFKIFLHDSKLEITSLVGTGRLGVVVVLGVGFANELPLELLIEKSDKLILIDGNLEPIKKMLKTSAFKKLGQKHVQLVQKDLTGGYYDLLKNRSSSLHDLLSDSFKKTLETGLTDLDDLANFLKEELIVDLSQYKPTVVISSLVTSQLYTLTIPIEKQLMLQVTQNFVDTRDSTDFIKLYQIFYDAAGRSLRQAIETAYYQGLISSGALAVYFADTNFHNLNQEALTGFRTQMKAAHYFSTEKSTVWFCRPDAPVSWIKFHQSPLCASCGKLAPSKKCPCEQVYYCDQPCQRAHWPMHKTTCQLAKK